MEIFGLNVIAAMMIAGALGGVLFGYRKGGLAFPRWSGERKRSLDLGCIADCVWGASGALVMFIIIPLDLKNGGDIAAQLTHHIRLLAIAFIGGYGGPAIMDLALSRTFRDLEKRTEEVAQQAEDVHTRLVHREEQEQRDIRALEYVDIQLGDTMQPVVREDLISAIRLASPAALENIFQRAKEARHEAWLHREKGEETHEMTERTIPVFEGLLACHYGKQRHRYHAQLGYALKDQEYPDWARARESLESAMALLEESGRPMSPFYKFNWAMCAIELDAAKNGLAPTPAELRDRIVESLKVATGFWKLRAAMVDDDCIHARLMFWLKRNHLSTASIGLAGSQPEVHDTDIVETGHETRRAKAFPPLRMVNRTAALQGWVPLT